MKHYTGMTSSTFIKQRLRFKTWDVAISLRLSAQSSTLSIPSFLFKNDSIIIMYYVGLVIHIRLHQML